MFTSSHGLRGTVGVVLEVVVGDVHARSGALRALLEAAGVLDARGRRESSAWVVQLGDLLDRRATPEANLETARVAAESVDLVLAGNHEARLLEAGGGTHGAALATLATRGWPHAAAAAGDWLVTHAGVHPAFARDLPELADECAAEINDRWHRSAADPLFDWIGPARGGDAPYGGIFWLDEEEWPPRGDGPWPQISGHVPQRRPGLFARRRWAIDVGRGGRLAALVRSRADEPWRPLVVAAPQRRARASV
jgi:hypothetical protein